MELDHVGRCILQQQRRAGSQDKHLELEDILLLI